MVWLVPTPIADRRTVDPLFGDLKTFDALVETVREFPMSVAADMVRDNGSPMHHERPDRLRLALDPGALRCAPFDAAAVQLSLATRRPRGRHRGARHRSLARLTPDRGSVQTSRGSVNVLRRTTAP